MTAFRDLIDQVVEAQFPSVKKSGDNNFQLYIDGQWQTPKSFDRLRCLGNLDNSEQGFFECLDMVVEVRMIDPFEVEVYTIVDCSEDKSGHKFWRINNRSQKAWSWTKIS